MFGLSTIAGLLACSGSNGVEASQEGERAEVDARQGSAKKEPEVAHVGTSESAQWRWESSLGLEVEVPAAWAINDVRCGMGDVATVLRARRGARRGCAPADLPTTQSIELAPDTESETIEPRDELVVRTVHVGTEPVERAEGRAKDGRFVGWLRVPRLHALVSVRVRERATLQHVLDSLRIVEVDHLGCPTQRGVLEPKPPAATVLVPVNTSSIVLCHYAQTDVLGASARVEAKDAARIAAMLNATVPHRNPDRPETECVRTTDPPKPDMLLIAESASKVAIVALTFSGCSGRGLYNGRDSAQVTRSLLAELMTPLHNAYGTDELPP